VRCESLERRHRSLSRSLLSSEIPVEAPLKRRGTYDARDDNFLALNNRGSCAGEGKIAESLPGAFAERRTLARAQHDEHATRSRHSLFPNFPAVPRQVRVFANSGKADLENYSVTRERLLRRRRAIPERMERAFPPGKTARAGEELFSSMVPRDARCSMQERYRYVRETSINRLENFSAPVIPIFRIVSSRNLASPRAKIPVHGRTLSRSFSPSYSFSSPHDPIAASAWSLPAVRSRDSSHSPRARPSRMSD